VRLKGEPGRLAGTLDKLGSLGFGVGTSANVRPNVAERRLESAASGYGRTPAAQLTRSASLLMTITAECSAATRFVGIADGIIAGNEEA
jgi:hypothetical protein